MECYVFYDESGDLGWKLDDAFRNHGSSRFFVIAFLIVPVDKLKYVTRFMVAFHKRRGGKKREYKGTEFRQKHAKSTARSIVEFLDRHPNIKIGYSTIDKQSVPIRLRSAKADHILYNYVVQKDICSTLLAFQKVTFIPDLRSVPKDSKNSCFDQIRSTLWLHHKIDVEIAYQPEESHNSDGLGLVDWIANFTWRNFENDYPDLLQILDPKLIAQNHHF